MLKAFLSHSSKQKGYIDIVAKHLGRSKIIYDAWTFEEGNKTLSEILNGLAESGLFVYFISDEALNSKWVEIEVNNAHELIRNDNIKKLYPIIIDEKINYDDPRIPDWIKENYNLKYISKPTKAATRINQILKIISWDLYPKNKQLSQLFIGRNDLVRAYEESIFNFDAITPIAMIASGLPSIGRRKFMTHCLVKSNKMREYNTPPSIYLGSRDSIENLIVSIYDLGFSKIDRKELNDLLTRELEDKIDLATKLLLEVEEHESILYVLDNYSIVGQDGNVVDWFLSLLVRVAKVNRMFICLASRRRIRRQSLIGNELIFAVNIPELEKYERNALFSALLEMHEAEISRDDLSMICDLFKGFPEQVFFTFNTYQTEGLPFLLDNLNLVTDFNAAKISQVIEDYETDNFAMQLLGFISECEFVSLAILELVFDGDDALKNILEKFASSFIIEFVGSTKEYVRLNDSIRDHIQRLNLKLDEKYNNKFTLHIRAAFNNYDTLDRDLSDYVISTKEALKKGLDIPEQLLLPSHFLNAMREIYNNDRRYKDVIALAERVLLQEKYLDKRIIREVRYWLCLSLARRRDPRVLSEVQHIDGPDHNFLLGFYYRLIGRLDDAIAKFKAVLEKSPRFFRAKRELVQVYLNLDEYDKAYGLAKENYEGDKNNPYSIQSYFRCLIKNGTIPMSDKRDILDELIDRLGKIQHDRAKEMFLTSKALYEAIVKNDPVAAKRTADDAIAAFPQSIYPFLTKIEISRKYNDWSELDKTIRRIEKKYNEESDILTKLNYLTAKALLLQKNGDIVGCEELLKTKIEPNFTPSVIERIRDEISSI